MLSYLGVLVLVSVTCTVVIACYAVRIKRQALKTEQACQASIESLTQELRGVSHGSIGIGRKALGLEQRIDALEAMLEEAQKNDPAKVSYAEASRLVDMGAGIEDLMNSCGISRPEAELVSALNKQNKEFVPTLVSNS